MSFQYSSRHDRAREARGCRAGLAYLRVPIPIIAAATLGAAAIGHAASGGTAASLAEADTEHLFGFTEGTDIGAAGEQEVEVDSRGDLGRRSGTYAVDSTELEYKNTLLQNFRVSANVAFAYYDISGVTGMQDVQRGVVQSLGFDARLKLLDRDTSPFGLTLNVEPHWGFFDEASGIPVKHFGVESLLRADREIVPNLLLGAINLHFDTERTREVTGGVVEQEPTIGAGAALAYQAASVVWLGAEVRYLRAYSGADLGVFAGQSVFAGPTLYAKLGKSAWISAAWNVQLWGGAAGIPGALDLVNFEHHEVTLRVGFNF